MALPRSASEEVMTARTWADLHSTPVLIRSPSICELHHEELMKGGGNEVISCVDNMRLFMLSRFAQMDLPEVQLKKTQKLFQVILVFLCVYVCVLNREGQQLGKNVVTHRQTYETLRMLAERLEATMTRIQDVEGDTERLLTQIQQSSTVEEDEALIKDELLQFKDLILSRMQNLANTSRNNIQEESARNALTTINKKRKERDLDEMLHSFLDFINSS